MGITLELMEWKVALYVPAARDGARPSRRSIRDDETSSGARDDAGAEGRESDGDVALGDHVGMDKGIWCGPSRASA